MNGRNSSTPNRGTLLCHYNPPEQLDRIGDISDGYIEHLKKLHAEYPDGVIMWLEFVPDDVEAFREALNYEIANQGLVGVKLELDSKYPCISI